MLADGSSLTALIELHKMETTLIVIIALFGLSVTALADDQQNIPARPFNRSYDCSFVTVNATGSECEDEMTCPDISMIVSESVSLVTPKMTTALDLLAKQFPNSSAVDTRRIYALSAVQC